MYRLKLITIFLCLLALFTLSSKAQTREPNGINCQLVTGEYLCEIIQIQSYEESEALRIASHVKAKANTEIVIGSDSLYVKYTSEKTYEVYGYSTPQVLLSSSKSVKDIRNELIVIINGIRLED